MIKSIVTFSLILGLHAGLEMGNYSASAFHSDYYTLLTDKSVINWQVKDSKAAEAGTLEFKNGKVEMTHGYLTGLEFRTEMATLVVTQPQSAKKQEKLKGKLTHEKNLHTDFYPEMHFKLNKVEKLPEESKGLLAFNANGRLSIKDHYEDISFPLTVMMNENGLDINATMEIDPAKWDMEMPLVLEVLVVATL